MRKLSTETNRLMFFPIQAVTRRLAILLFFLFCGLTLYGNAQAIQVSPFGPTHYSRQTGSPVVENASFTVDNLNGKFSLIVYNGGLEDDATLGKYVSSSTITLNGVVVVGPQNFNQNVTALTIPVSLASSNQLTVKLNGKPGGVITIAIVGEVNTTPVADTGIEQTVITGQAVTLDGSSSSDLDGDSINYSWTLIAKPLTSQAVINHANAVTANFTADVAGSYIAELVVNDGELDSLPSQVLITALPQNQPPVLSAIGNQVIELGSTLTLDLHASDTNGDPLTYSVQPLPLPDGARLDGETGQFRFKADSNQIGSVELTFSVSDGVFSDSETVTLTIPSIDTTVSTRFSGRILDANDYAQGFTTPVVGTTISFLNTGQFVQTDAQGYFFLDNLPEGAQVLDINSTTAVLAPDGSRYAGFRENYRLIANVENTNERPFYMPRLDEESLTTVDPAITTVVNNETLGVSITVPPYTAKNPDGSYFTGDLSISLVPRDLAPAALPDFLDPGLLVTIQPVGVTFSTPAAFTFPNIDDLEPGSEVDIWSVDPSLGQFIIVGTGQVTMDGLAIETVSGGINAADWHTTMPSQPNVSGDPNEKEAPNKKPCDEDKTFSTSTITTLTGCLNTGFSLPDTISQGQNRGLSFVYKSRQANPVMMIPFDTTIPVRSAVPPKISYQVEVGGVKMGRETFVSTSGFSEGLDETLRGVASFDANDFPTGVYPYQIHLTNHFSQSRIATDISDRVVVVNEQDSPLGAGWGIASLSRLYFQAEGTVLITDGNGGRTQYTAEIGSVTGTTVLNEDFENGVNASNWSSTVSTQATNFSRFLGRFGNDSISLNLQNLPAHQAIILSFDLYQIDSWDGSGTRNGPDSFSIGTGTQFNNVLDTTLPNSEFQPTLTGALGFYSRFSDSIYRSFNDGFIIAHEDSNLTVNFQGRGLQTLDDESWGLDNISVKVLTQDSFTTYRTAEGDYSNLLQNTDGTFTRTLKNGTQIYFNSEGLQTQITDRNGNTTLYAYDSQQRLIFITDPVGKLTVLTYTGDFLNTVTDSAGRISQFEHDQQGNLIKITFPDGTFKTFGYDDRHLMTSETDQRSYTAVREYDAAGRISAATRADGSLHAASHAQTVGLVNLDSGLGTVENPAALVRPGAVESTFTDGEGHSKRSNTDAFGRLISRTDANGLTTLIERDENGNAIKTTRPDGSIINRVFDEQGNLLSETQAFNNASTQYTYDPVFNLLTSVTDAFNQTTITDRDNKGNISSIVNPLGHSTAIAYNSAGQVTQMTNPNGLVIDTVYNTAGLPATITEMPPANGGVIRTTQISYDNAGLATRIITAPDGLTVNLSYDQQGRLVGVTDLLNQKIDYHYDASGNRIRIDTQETDGSLTTTISQTFDALNRLSSINQPHISGQDSVQQFQYDGADNLAQSIDANGHVNDQVFDPGKRLVERIDALLGSTSFTYNANGQITQTVAPNGSVTDYQFDTLDRVISETSADRGTLSYSYDLNNNPISITDARGITATYRYDELNRLTGIQYPEPRENITLSYDQCTFGIGRLCSVIDVSGHAVFDYDAYGNTIQVTEIREGISYAQHYQYDGSHRLSNMTLPSGRVVNYSRDSLQRIQSITTDINSVSQSIIDNIDYNAANQIIQQHYGNGLIENRSYDLQSRLLQQTLNNVDQTGLSYDANSNVLIRNTATDSHSYAYDVLDRLVEEINNGTASDYQYDANDNRTRQTQNTQSILYDYIPDSNQLELITTDSTSQSLLYDASGNLTQDAQGREYRYNNAGRLKEIINNGQLLASYRYNANGQRTHKITATKTTLYHYDLTGQLSSETLSDGTPVRDYLWQGNTPIAQIDYQNGTETLVYLHTDHLNTPRLSTGSNQSIVWRWEGDAFGQAQPQGLGATINFRFPGQYYDLETGLYYNYYRYYDPSTGRYITSDPIGLDGGLNTYGYVGGNPLRYIDPTGEAAAAAGLCFIPGVGMVSCASAGAATGAVFCAIYPRQCAKAAADICSNISDSFNNFFGPYFNKASDSGKNEKHGDGGRASSKADQQIKELEEKLKYATGRERKQILQKIKNIRETARRKAKGEEHSRGPKR